MYFKKKTIDNVSFLIVSQLFLNIKNHKLQQHTIQIFDIFLYRRGAFIVEKDGGQHVRSQRRAEANGHRPAAAPRDHHGLRHQRCQEEQGGL